jgi:hypothetical protein
MSVGLRLGLGLLSLMWIAHHHASAEPDQRLSAGSVLPGCRDLIVLDNRRNEFAQGVCAGIVGSMFYFSERFGFCVPATATGAELVGVIVVYIEQLPARRTEPFEELALEALAKTWPCEGGS